MHSRKFGTKSSNFPTTRIRRYFQFFSLKKLDVELLGTRLLQKFIAIENFFKFCIVYVYNDMYIFSITTDLNNKKRKLSLRRLALKCQCCFFIQFLRSIHLNCILTSVITNNGYVDITEYFFLNEVHNEAQMNNNAQFIMTKKV